MVQSTYEPSEQQGTQNDSTMAPRFATNKDATEVMNLSNGNQGDNHHEDSVALTDIFLNFKASCLNRARDIRDLSAKRDNLNLSAREYGELQRMIETLNEQFELLEDAWRTLLRYVQDYSIKVDEDKHMRIWEKQNNTQQR